MNSFVPGKAERVWFGYSLDQVFELALCAAADPAYRDRIIGALGLNRNEYGAEAIRSVFNRLTSERDFPLRDFGPKLAANAASDIDDGLATLRRLVARSNYLQCAPAGVVQLAGNRLLVPVEPKHPVTRIEGSGEVKLLGHPVDAVYGRWNVVEVETATHVGYVRNRRCFIEEHSSILWRWLPVKQVLTIVGDLPSFINEHR